MKLKTERRRMMQSAGAKGFLINSRILALHTKAASPARLITAKFKKLFDFKYL
jgi:hypothetical protein